MMFFLSTVSVAELAINPKEIVAEGLGGELYLPQKGNWRAVVFAGQV